MKHLIFIAAVGLCLATSGCKSREEELAAEHGKGVKLVENKAAQVQGVGEALQSQGQKAAAELSTGVGKVIGGVAQGIDRAKETSIAADATASQLGLSSDRAVVQFGEKNQNITLKAYIKATQSFNGSLHVRGLDGQGREVGRSTKAERKLDADDAKYVEFEFDAATPMARVAKWTLFAAVK